VKAFNTPGIYRLECDVHRWMNAWVFVHEGVHAAVSAADGRFTINRVRSPTANTSSKPGTRSFPQKLSQTVTVRDGKATADFAFRLRESLSTLTLLKPSL
jgi:hypothetical protein